MKENYTRDEVIQLLVNERQRAIDIAYHFRNVNHSSYKAKLNTKNEYTFIDKHIN